MNDSFLVCLTDIKFCVIKRLQSVPRERNEDSVPKKYFGALRVGIEESYLLYRALV